MAIEIGKLPPVLPVNVARTTEGGLPTKPLIDWEQFSRDWYKKTAVDLDTRVNTVETTLEGEGGETLTAKVERIDTTVGDADSGLVQATSSVTTEVETARQGQTTLSARVTQVDNARIEGDKSTAVAGLTVDAVANMATASGAMKISAVAAPSGATAAYQWQLVAGSVSTGMTAVAKSDGTSAITFTTGQFTLNDPGLDGGAPTNVFSYTLGRFEFNVPVRVKTLDIADAAVSYPKIEDAAVSRMPNAGGVTFAEVTVTTRETSKLLILGTFNPPPANRGDYGTPNFSGVLRILKGASVLVDQPHPRDLYSGTMGVHMGGQVLFVDIPGAGTFTYRAETTNAAGHGNMGIIVVDLSR